MAACRLGMASWWSLCMAMLHGKEMALENAGAGVRETSRLWCVKVGTGLHAASAGLGPEKKAENGPKLVCKKG